jgi:hypothetical protein
MRRGDLCSGPAGGSSAGNRRRPRLNADSDPVDKIDQLPPRVVDRYRDMVAALETTVSKEMSHARNYVRALVSGEIELMPTKAGVLEAHLQGNYAGVIALTNESPA